jgi:tRNA G37 N-methylase Trm5
LLKEKEEELLRIAELDGYKTEQLSKIAVLGVADNRHVQGHRDLFSKILGHAVDINTFDITTEHLSGETQVYAQDVTEAIPYGPYDIVYSHVLLKFIPKEKQMRVIENSVAALKHGGIAIHVFGIGPRYKENDPTVKEIQAYCEKLCYSSNFITLPTKGTAVVLMKK